VPLSDACFLGNHHKCYDPTCSDWCHRYQLLSPPRPSEALSDTVGGIASATLILLIIASVLFRFSPPGGISFLGGSHGRPQVVGVVVPKVRDMPSPIPLRRDVSPNAVVDHARRRNSRRPRRSSNMRLPSGGPGRMEKPDRELVGARLPCVDICGPKAEQGATCASAQEAGVLQAAVDSICLKREKI
jgi:hypothetical protein